MEKLVLKTLSKTGIGLNLTLLLECSDAELPSGTVLMHEKVDGLIGGSFQVLSF